MRITALVLTLAATTTAGAVAPGTYACRTDGLASFGRWPSGPGSQFPLETAIPKEFSTFLLKVEDKPNAWCDSPEPLNRVSATRWWQCQPHIATFNSEFPISILRGGGASGGSLISHDSAVHFFMTLNNRFTLTHNSGSLVMVGQCVGK